MPVWIVNPANPSLARATVNRVWALLFGRPWSNRSTTCRPRASCHPALVLLADDFAAHGYDLHRLIRVIAATDAVPPREHRRRAASADSPNDETWAVFPMTRLRPEQVAGAIFQSASLTTLGPQSHWFVRLVSYTGRNEFVRRYGDTGEDEFAARGGTIPQRLLLHERRDRAREDSRTACSTASSAIAELAPDDPKAVEAAYLAVLTRRPTPEELSHFAGRLAGTTGDERKERLSDLFWTLLNTTEFSWNH